MICYNLLANLVFIFPIADKELTANDEPSFMYYVNDGVYGSFNCLLYDHAVVEPTLIEVSTKYYQ